MAKAGTGDVEFSHLSDWDRDAALTTARILLEIEAINFRPQEAYTFTSGWKSPVYIDCPRIIYFPRARNKNRRGELGQQKINRHVGYETIEAVGRRRNRRHSVRCLDRR